MADYEQLLELLQGYEMGYWERRSQSISWVVGQLALSFPSYDSWLAAKQAAEAWDLKYRWG
jgi:hypothetical protein